MEPETPRRIPADDLHREQVRRIKTGLDRQQTPHAVKEQSRADKQNESQRDFGDDQSASRRSATARGTT